MSQQIINKQTGEIIDKFDKVRKAGNSMFLEDKEINFAAAIAKILETTKKQVI